MVGAVERLVAAGVGLGQIGVICFFRAQVALVRSLLERRLPQLEGMQRRHEHAAALGRGSTSESEAAAGSGNEAGGGAGEGEEAEEGRQQGRQASIQVATVDSYQGAECEAIILTTTVTRTSTFASGEGACSATPQCTASSALLLAAMASTAECRAQHCRGVQRRLT